MLIVWSIKRRADRRAKLPPSGPTSDISLVLERQVPLDCSVGPQLPRLLDEVSAE
jgi:hypothetical protein